MHVLRTAIPRCVCHCMAAPPRHRVGSINKKGPLELFAQKNKENIKNGDAVPEQIRDDIGSGMTARNCAGGTKKEKAPPDVLRQAGRESSGDLLSRARGPGTIGDLRLNFRVRDGNGCDPHSITAETNSCMEPRLFKQPQGVEAA